MVVSKGNKQLVHISCLEKGIYLRLQSPLKAKIQTSVTAPTYQREGGNSLSGLCGTHLLAALVGFVKKLSILNHGSKCM